MCYYEKKRREKLYLLKTIKEKGTMYCSHCGAQIPDDAAFCPSCGQKPGRASQPAAQTAAPQTAPPPQASYAQPAPRYVEAIKSEGEFIQEYRNLHNYTIYTNLLIFCKIADVVFTLGYLFWMFYDIQDRYGEYWSRIMDFEDFLAYLPLWLGVSLGITIVGYVMQKKKKEIDQSAQSEYQKYKQKLETHGTKSSASISSDNNNRNLGYSGKVHPSSTSIPPNSWRCPNCGRTNTNYVDTCVCGGKKNS